MIKPLYVIERCQCCGSVNYCTNKLVTNSLFSTGPLVQSKQSRLVLIEVFIEQKQRWANI